MSREWPTRSFKSGNSVAVRIPAGVGVEPNKDWVLVERDGELVLRALVAPISKIDVSSFWGKAKGMVHVPSPTEDFEPRPSSLRHDP